MRQNKVRRFSPKNVETNSSEEEQALAYATGVFQYLRMLVHILGIFQFSYAIYFWLNLHLPRTSMDELGAEWGGKLKYLTFLNTIIQAVYHSIAFLNDVCGSNLLTAKRAPVLRTLRDNLFAVLSFPLSLNVCLSFWVIYAYDRELIFPVALDVIFPNWLNHIVHTNVLMLGVLDLFTCFRQYPSRFTGISTTSAFILLYIVWIHVVRQYSGHWPYPILDKTNFLFRYLLLSALIGFTAICYFIGECINNIIWANEIKLIQKKLKFN